MSACEQLAIQMDVLEEYLKIEKLDPTQVPDAAIKHKEESFAKMTSEFSSVENSGKQFIKDANDVSMHGKCSSLVFERCVLSDCELRWPAGMRSLCFCGTPTPTPKLENLGLQTRAGLTIRGPHTNVRRGPFLVREARIFLSVAVHFSPKS